MQWCSALPSCLYLERDRLQLWTFESAGEGIQIPAQVSQTMGRRLLPKTLRPLRWLYFETKIAYLTAFLPLSLPCASDSGAASLLPRSLKPQVRTNAVGSVGSHIFTPNRNPARNFVSQRAPPIPMTSPIPASSIPGRITILRMFEADAPRAILTPRSRVRCRTE